MEDNARPAKRVKLDGNSKQHSSRDSENTNANTSADSHGERSKKSRNRQFHSRDKAKSHSSNGASKPTGHKAVQRTFSQPSVMCPGDKGIFVSSDKGKEKNALLELSDLVQQYLERQSGAGGGAPKQAGTNTNPEGSSDAAHDTVAGIEADIAAELAELRGTETTVDEIRAQSKPAQLITLDIPCVSFLRLAPGTSVDPVELVHKLCLQAADPTTSQQSRYVKRLTPISSLVKVLSQGLEKLCDEVLPPTFGPDSEGNIKSVKFAIRPTTRNNDKVDRDTVIQTVAKRIEALGKGKHTVDLKNYEKAVNVEVYRNWIGMSVIDNGSSERFPKGFEELKRFNLAEIYADRNKKPGDS